MYGDDILILEATEPSLEGQKAKITIFSDTESEAETMPKIKSRSFRDTLKEEDNGVQFERNNRASLPSNKEESKNLRSLRKFATEQILVEKKKEAKQELVGLGKQYLPSVEPTQEKTSQFYRRANLRPTVQKNIQEKEMLQDDTPSL